MRRWWIVIGIELSILVGKRSNGANFPILLLKILQRLRVELNPHLWFLHQYFLIFVNTRTHEVHLLLVLSISKPGKRQEGLQHKSTITYLGQSLLNSNPILCRMLTRSLGATFEYWFLKPEHYVHCIYQTNCSVQKDISIYKQWRRMVIEDELPSVNKKAQYTPRF